MLYKCKKCYEFRKYNEKKIRKVKSKFEGFKKLQENKQT